MINEQFLEATRRAKFNALIMRYGKLLEEGRGDSREALDVLAEALPLTPPEHKVRLDEIMTEILGPKPQAEYCDENGQPCYTIQQVEKWLGRKIDAEEIAEIQPQSPHSRNIHRIL